MSPQKLGQHFLKDGGWRAKILSEMSVRPSDTWLEIGAGHGEMTRELARVAQHVLAIEVDAGVREELCQLAAAYPNVAIIPGDILQLNLAEVLGSEKARVYGSLPYYITSPILRRLFAHAAQIHSIAVVIQLEVAQRIVAQPHSRDYGFLSVLAQYYAEPEIALRIPSSAFTPPPQVESALVLMRLPGQRAKLGITDDAAFERFLQACFAQKRKTLLNNLKVLASAEKAATTIAAAGVKPQARAEELAIPELAALFHEFTK